MLWAMIDRDSASLVLAHARWFPVVTITGPRQSGKTTLVRALFPDKPYLSLEPLDARARARDDPRGLLEELSEGAILDEVQHVPARLSYLQGEVDARPEPGRFVLTGSRHFGLSEAVAQSLAGRTAVLELLPPSLGELRRFAACPDDLLAVLWTGAYPAIHDRGVPADVWLRDYVRTYVERDVRQVLAVSDLIAFRTFVALCAGRTGTVLNLSALGADAGVSHNTARKWLSVLETSYLALRLPPWHQRVRKQLIEAPKLHLLDSGLACHLLGIRTPEELRHHPLRGAIFESWVVAEARKLLAHQGQAMDLLYFRDRRGLEVDLVRPRGRVSRWSRSGPEPQFPGTRSRPWTRCATPSAGSARTSRCWPTASSAETRASAGRRAGACCRGGSWPTPGGCWRSDRAAQMRGGYSPCPAGVFRPTRSMMPPWSASEG